MSAIWVDSSVGPALLTDMIVVTWKLDWVFYDVFFLMCGAKSETLVSHALCDFSFSSRLAMFYFYFLTSVTFSRSKLVTKQILTQSDDEINSIFL